jgi:major membrane immunogen (membrane-anchored lipoprotein)
MKKFLLGFVMLLALFTVGCEKQVGNYKEGTYIGSHEYSSYGKNYVTTAVLYVNEEGLIKSVFIDSTYFKDEVYTTKKVLGDEYGMKEASAEVGTIEGGAEWYEQIEVLEDKLVKEQDLEWFTFSNEQKTKTDAVSGVTITVDSYYAALTNALELAKK